MKNTTVKLTITLALIGVLSGCMPGSVGSPCIEKGNSCLSELACNRAITNASGAPTCQQRQETGGDCLEKADCHDYYSCDTTINKCSLSLPQEIAIETRIVGHQQVTLGWTNPRNATFSHVLIRYIDTNDPNADAEFLRVPAEGTRGTLTIDGLTNGKTYAFTIIPVNVRQESNGDTVESTLEDVNTISVIPREAPFGYINITVAGEQATLKWKNPAVVNFGHVEIGYTPVGEESSSMIRVLGGEEEETITELDNTIQYDVVITAYNQADESMDATAIRTIDDRELIITSSAISLNLEDFFGSPDSGVTRTYTSETSGTSSIVLSRVDNMVTLTPSPSERGITTVTLTAKTTGDNTDISVEQTFNVTVGNSAPVSDATIGNRILTLGMDETIELADSFSDPDGDMLTYSFEPDTNSVVDVTVMDSTLTLMPLATGIGMNTQITVTATDTAGAFVEQNLNVTVQNRAPVSVGTIADRVLIVGMNETINLDDSFSDPDGGMLSYGVSAASGGVVNATVAGSTLTLRPIATGMGLSTRITVTATDTNGGTATQDFTVRVNSVPISAGTIGNRVLRVGMNETINLAGSFSDPDGGTLSYSVSAASGGVVNATVAGSTLTLRPIATGMGLSTQITVTATDPDGETATQDFGVRVNSVPISVDTMITDRVLPVGTNQTIGLSNIFRDPDGDMLTYSVSSGSADVVDATVVGDILTVSPLATGIGMSTQITVTATDTHGDSLSQRFTVTVQNSAPTSIGTIADRVLSVGTDAPIDFSNIFRDSDGDTLSYSASSDPADIVGTTVVGTILTVRPLPTGIGMSTEITITANDSRGGLATIGFMVMIMNEPLGDPTITTITAANEQATISWSNPSDPYFVGVRISWREVPGGTFNAPRDVGNATQYTATGLTNRTEYVFRLRAYDTANNGSTGVVSAPRIVADSVPPDPVTNPSASLVTPTGDLTVSWSNPSDVADVASVEVIYTDSADTSATLSLVRNNGRVPTTGRIPATSLTPGTVYRVAIALVDLSGNASTAVAVADTIDTTPFPPTNLQSRIAPGGILLGWEAPTGGGVSGFNVYNTTDSATALNGAPLGGDATGYLVTGLAVGISHAFEVETVFTIGATTAVSSRSGATVAITFVELGSADTPWRVSSAAELRSIATGFRSTAAANGGTAAMPVTRTPAQSLEEHYLQTGDITLCADATATTCDPFVPIGNHYYTDSGTTHTPFRGSYDGGGNEIIGLRVDSGVGGAPALRAWGLFGFVTGATAEIRNVTLRSPAVTGTDLTGALVGILGDDSTVTDSAVDGGTVTGVGRVGGLVGHLNSRIVNSYATGDVNGGDGDDDRVGGLLGFSQGTIQNSYATGDVNGGGGNGDRVGGLVGWVNHGTTENSYATGDVDGGAGADDRVGGLVGRSGGTIRNSYATGNVDGGDGDDDIVGGLVGNHSSNGTIQNSYATGNVDGGDGNLDHVGGLAGIVERGTVENSYATGDVDGGAGDTDRVGGLVGLVDNGGTVRNSYATGDVDGGIGDDTIGGLLGNNFSSTITNSYYSGADMDAGETGGDGDNFNTLGNARTLAQLRCPTNPNDNCNGATTYTGWSSANWDFGDTNALPKVLVRGSATDEVPGQ